ncbi:hypothetical protein Tco_0906253 [Tanacetum coccineum]
MCLLQTYDLRVGQEGVNKAIGFVQAFVSVGKQLLLTTPTTLIEAWKEIPDVAKEDVLTPPELQSSSKVVRLLLLSSEVKLQLNFVMGRVGYICALDVVRLDTTLNNYVRYLYVKCEAFDYAIKFFEFIGTSGGGSKGYRKGGGYGGYGSSKGFGGSGGCLRTTTSSLMTQVPLPTNIYFEGTAYMVGVSCMMNATLVIPELDKRLFLQEKVYIFDEDHFIDSLKADVSVIKNLYEELVSIPRAMKHFTSWGS